MRQWRITHPIHAAPERKALQTLRAALDLAQDAVRREHQRLEFRSFEDHTPLPPSEIVARLLVERCMELETLVQYYNSVVDWTMGDDPNDDEDGYPF